MVRGAWILQLVAVGSLAIALIVIALITVDHFRSTASPQSLSLLAINETDFQQNYVIDNKRQAVSNVLRSLPGFDDGQINCSLLTAKSSDFKAYERARQWKFDIDHYYKSVFRRSHDKCVTLKERFAFFDEPLTEEERNYPLAYGFLVYDSSVQIYFLLSAIYQPQNAYCIAVDSKSSETFKKDMDLLGDCLPNVYVIQVNDVQWYKFSVVRGVWSCVRLLAALNHPWKYYQYLSGADLPLKTNLEMVRIFKQLNNTTNIEVKPIPSDRIRRVKSQDWPLQLYKSSLSGLLTREGVNAMMASDKIREFIRFSQKLECPDEALWATIFGNPNTLAIPSTFDASAVLKRLQSDEQAIKKKCTLSKWLAAVNNTSVEEPFVMQEYYISRYQVWMWPFTDFTHPFCHGKICSISIHQAQGLGKFAHYSCVYGVADLRNLLSRPELIAHKFYMDVEPAGYFCLYEAIRNRAFDTDRQSRFCGNAYSQLAYVRLAAGESVENVTFHNQNCRAVI